MAGRLVTRRFRRRMLDEAHVRESRPGSGGLPSYLAFLRGINVGGHRVKMDRLRALFTGLGLNDVSTYLASGNVGFTTDSRDPALLRERLERHLASSLGYAVPLFLRTPDQIAEIVSFDLSEPDSRLSDSGSHYVILLNEADRGAARSRLAPLASDLDEFHFAETEVHLLTAGKLSESPLFGAELDRALRGLRNTMRNMNTLRRIAATHTSSQRRA